MFCMPAGEHSGGRCAFLLFRNLCTNILVQEPDADMHIVPGESTAMKQLTSPSRSMLLLITGPHLDTEETDVSGEFLPS